jgi:MFS family permease
MSGTRSVVAQPEFQRLLVARTISSIGNGMGPIALAFGVLALPGADATSLSIVLAAQALPVVLLLPLGGVIADRVGSARMIWSTDVILSAFVMTSAVLLMTGRATVPILAVIGVISGVLNALWYPAYAGLVPDTVKGEERLQPANALIGVGTNAGYIIGTAIAGILVAAWGPGQAIAIDALTFLTAGILVFTIRSTSVRRDSGESMMGDLVHGWRLFVSYRWVVVVVGSWSLIVMAWRGGEEVMGPALSLQVYDGPRGWSIVMAAQAVGLLVGAVVATRLRWRRPLFAVCLASLTLPLWFVSLAFAWPLVVVVPLSFAWGWAFEQVNVVWMTAMQANIPRESLSRVSAYDHAGSLMFGPIGLALAGPVVALLGLRESLFLVAAIATVGVSATLVSRSVRQVSLTPGER